MTTEEYCEKQIIAYWENTSDNTRKSRGLALSILEMVTKEGMRKPEICKELGITRHYYTIMINNYLTEKEKVRLKNKGKKPKTSEKPKTEKVLTREEFREKMMLMQRRTS